MLSAITMIKDNADFRVCSTFAIQTIVFEKFRDWHMIKLLLADYLVNLKMFGL